MQLRGRPAASGIRSHGRTGSPTGTPVPSTSGRVRPGLQLSVSPWCGGPPGLTHPTEPGSRRQFRNGSLPPGQRTHFGALPSTVQRQTTAGEGAVSLIPVQTRRGGCTRHHKQGSQGSRDTWADRLWGYAPGSGEGWSQVRTGRAQALPHPGTRGRGDGEVSCHESASTGRTRGSNTWAKGNARGYTITLTTASSNPRPVLEPPSRVGVTLPVP